MSEADKKLLTIAICSYLPYGLRLDVDGEDMDCLGFAFGKCVVTKHLMSDAKSVELEQTKLYLRPLISMTEQEAEELRDIYQRGLNSRDWLNKHHFDYKALIEKGLAYAALKDMYFL